MKTKWHRETIEALGMIAPKKRIVNKLNAVAAHSDDPRLQKMAEVLIKEILSAISNTQGMAPVDMKNGVPSAKAAIEYCSSQIHSE